MGVVGRHRNDVGRLAGQRQQPLLDPERAQHLDGVRPELQSGADLAELAGAFVDVDLEAALAQRAADASPPMPAPITAMRACLVTFPF